MKKLKFIAIFLTFTVTFSLYGCSNSSDNTDEAVSEEQALTPEGGATAFLEAFKSKDYEKTLSCLAEESELFGNMLRNKNTTVVSILNHISDNFSYEIKDIVSEDEITATINVEMTNLNMEKVIASVVEAFWTESAQKISSGESAEQATNNNAPDLILDALNENASSMEKLTQTIPVSLIKDTTGEWKIVSDTDVFDGLTGNYISFAVRVAESVNKIQ